MKKKRLSEQSVLQLILRGTWVLALLLCTHLALFAQADKMITIRKSNVPIREVLELIQKEADTHFVYDEQTVSPHIRVTLDYSSPAKLSEVLDDLCKQASIRYEVKRGFKRSSGDRISDLIERAGHRFVYCAECRKYKRQTGN